MHVGCCVNLVDIITNQCVSPSIVIDNVQPTTLLAIYDRSPIALWLSQHPQLTSVYSKYLLTTPMLLRCECRPMSVWYRNYSRLLTVVVVGDTDTIAYCYYIMLYYFFCVLAALIHQNLRSLLLSGNKRNGVETLTRRMVSIHARLLFQ